MAANFWTSSHYKQLLEQEEVDVVHAMDKDRGITLEDFKLIKLHMTNYISKLAQSVKGRQRLRGPMKKLLFLWEEPEINPLLRHHAFPTITPARVVATAVAYMRRVYTKKTLTEYDPYLVASTCLYLASKAEESTVQTRLLVFYIKKIVPDKYEKKDILEMEMKILEALNYYLVVFHPYRSLSPLLQDAGMTDLTQICWGLINDTYKMDLILVYPPHLITLACIYVATVLKDKESTAWFEELRVDMNVVKNIAMEILDFYDGHKMITDERINAAMGKLPAH